MDLEASGFGSDSYPIEVGLVTDTGRRYCRLIKPIESWTHWSLEAQGLHGISRQVLQEKGHSVYEICDELNQQLANKIVYSDGWVVDHPWLIKLFHAAGRQMLFRLSPLETILSEVQMEHWHHTKDELEKQLDTTRHRASSDAELIQRVYVHTGLMHQSAPVAAFAQSR